MTFYNFAKKAVWCVFKPIFKIEITGFDNIPEDSNAIICANHISMLDPVIIGISIKRQIFYMTKREMYKNKFLAFLLLKLGTFPIDREGADLSAIKKSLKILKQKNLLGIFPEGTRVKTRDIENAKPGIGMICIKGKSPVIPIYIDATYKFFSKVKITVGKPLDFSDMYGQKLALEDYQNISKTILKNIYDLKK